MARTVLTYGGLNLNDGVNYFLLPGFDPGERVKTFDEYRGYGGAVAQANVSEAYLITMTVPLIVQGTDATSLRACIDAINAEVDGGAQTLTYGPTWAPTDYDCVQSPRIGYPRDEVALATHAAFVTFAPNRTPAGSNLLALRFPSLTGVAKVLYVGDSLTGGYYAVTEPLCYRELIDDYLATIGITDTTWTASAGGTAGDIHLDIVAAAAADLCFIEMGTNDCGTSVPIATFRANMRAISAAARVHNPACQMVYLTTWKEWTPRLPYDAVIREVAYEYQGVVIDLDATGLDATNYGPAGVSTFHGTSDNWHPNDTGHLAISRITEIGILSGWPSGWTRFGEGTNYLANPRLKEYGTTGIATYWNDASTGHGSKVFDIVDAGDGTYYQEVVYTVNASDLTGAGHNVLFNLDTGAGVFAPGDPASFGIEYQLVVSNARSCTGGHVSLYNQDTTSSNIASFAPAAGWTAAAASVASLSGTTTSVSLFVVADILNATGVAGDTITLRFRHTVLTKTPAAAGFFYGHTPGDPFTHVESSPNARWVGSPDISYSRKYLAAFGEPGFTLLADVNYTTTMWSPLVPVTGGVAYRCAGTVAITARAGGTLTATVDWYGVAGTVLSSTTLATLASVVSTPLSTAITAPAGATHALVKTAWSGATGPCAAVVTDLSMRQV